MVAFKSLLSNLFCTFCGHFAILPSPGQVSRQSQQARGGSVDEAPGMKPGNIENHYFEKKRISSYDLESYISGYTQHRFHRPSSSTDYCQKNKGVRKVNAGNGIFFFRPSKILNKVFSLHVRTFSKFGEKCPNHLFFCVFDFWLNFIQ